MLNCTELDVKKIVIVYIWVYLSYIFSTFKHFILLRTQNNKSAKLIFFNISSVYANESTTT